MMHPEEVAALPIYVGGLLIICVAVFGAVAAELVARWVLPHGLRRDHASSASTIFTVIGTTYAVLLAFVTMLSWEGWNGANAATDSEAALAGNVYELLGEMSGPDAAQMRADIVAYVHDVAAREWPMQARGEAVGEQAPALARLMRTALHVQPQSLADANLHRLLLEDVTRLEDARHLRLSASRSSIPGIVWFVLIAGGGITIAFASFLGSPNLVFHLTMSSLLAVSGALVLLIVVALSNPFRGDMRVTPAPFARALAGMDGVH